MRHPQIDGILNLDKPYGITSMDVVRRIKRASRVKRVGHGGTLDPVATGVVPICFGRATRIMEYLFTGTKEYRGVVELGVATDTYDAFGKATAREDPTHLTREEIEHALRPFEGDIDQIPPMYSALKRQGKRLYDLARAGIEVEREPRKVKVLSIELLDWSPPLLGLQVRCGRGFYMRSLAHDLGQSLRCGGNLKNLVRLKNGPFEISDALSLEEAERLFENGAWQDALYAPDVVLQNMRAIVVGQRAENSITHGRGIPAGTGVASLTPEERCRAYSVDGRFLAVLALDAPTRQWRPERVFATARH